MVDAITMPEIIFQRDNHIRYFVEALRKLPRGYSSQESLRLTLCYFAVAGLDLLDALDQVSRLWFSPVVL